MDQQHGESCNSRQLAPSDGQIKRRGLDAHECDKPWEALLQRDLQVEVVRVRR